MTGEIWSSKDWRRTRDRMRQIIFGTDTPAGRAFDVIVLWMILLSVLAVMLDSVSGIRAEYGPALRRVEWFFTISFTLEYVLRVLSINRPGAYVGSFFGVVDLLSFLPTYLSLFFYGGHSLLVFRVFRLLRVFRIFKLGRYVRAANVLIQALRMSRDKIIVFLGAVLSLVLIMGTVMYLIEGEQNGFSSIPQSIYWAIVTLTTVGYGDLAPQTVAGRMVASIIMIMGYAIIAVPTGFVSFEIAAGGKAQAGMTARCLGCGRQDHPRDARFCRICGGRLGDGGAGAQNHGV